MMVPKGRVAYEPSSLDGGFPRENPKLGFKTFRAEGAPETTDAEKTRRRKDTFADHYSQARMFFNSLGEPERRHVISAFSFELSKVESKPVRCRMLGHLQIIDQVLASSVESALGMEGQAQFLTPAVQPKDLAPSPAVSIVARAVPTLESRKVGVLVTNGVDSSLLHELQSAVDAERGVLVLIAPKVGGVTDRAGNLLEADFALSAAPSIFFDAVVVLCSEAGAKALSTEAAAVDWVRDAVGHLKVVGHSTNAAALFAAAGVQPDVGIIPSDDKASIRRFVAEAKKGRVWDREAILRSPG